MLSSSFKRLADQSGRLPSRSSSSTQKSSQRKVSSGNYEAHRGIGIIGAAKTIETCKQLHPRSLASRSVGSLVSSSTISSSSTIKRSYVTRERRIMREGFDHAPPMHMATLKKVVYSPTNEKAEIAEDVKTLLRAQMPVATLRAIGEKQLSGSSLKIWHRKVGDLENHMSKLSMEVSRDLKTPVLPDLDDVTDFPDWITAVEVLFRSASFFQHEEKHYDLPSAATFSHWNSIVQRAQTTHQFSENVQKYQVAEYDMQSPNLHIAAATERISKSSGLSTSSVADIINANHTELFQSAREKSLALNGAAALLDSPEELVRLRAYGKAIEAGKEEEFLRLDEAKRSEVIEKARQSRLETVSHYTRLVELVETALIRDYIIRRQCANKAIQIQEADDLLQKLVAAEESPMNWKKIKSTPVSKFRESLPRLLKESSETMTDSEITQIKELDVLLSKLDKADSGLSKPETSRLVTLLNESITAASSSSSSSSAPSTSPEDLPLQAVMQQAHILLPSVKTTNEGKSFFDNSASTLTTDDFELIESIVRLERSLALPAGFLIDESAADLVGLSRAQNPLPALDQGLLSALSPQSMLSLLKSAQKDIHNELFPTQEEMTLLNFPRPADAPQYNMLEMEREFATFNPEAHSLLSELKVEANEEAQLREAFSQEEEGLEDDASNIASSGANAAATSTSVSASAAAASPSAEDHIIGETSEPEPVLPLLRSEKDDIHAFMANYIDDTGRPFVESIKEQLDVAGDTGSSVDLRTTPAYSQLIAARRIIYERLLEPFQNDQAILEQLTRFLDDAFEAYPQWFPRRRRALSELLPLFDSEEKIMSVDILEEGRISPEWKSQSCESVIALAGHFGVLPEEQKSALKEIMTHTSASHSLKQGEFAQDPSKEIADRIEFVPSGALAKAKLHTIFGNQLGTYINTLPESSPMRSKANWALWTDFSREMSGNSLTGASALPASAAQHPSLQMSLTDLMVDPVMRRIMNALESKIPDESKWPVFSALGATGGLPKGQLETTQPWIAGVPSPLTAFPARELEEVQEQLSQDYTRPSGLLYPFRPTPGQLQRPILTEAQKKALIDAIPENEAEINAFMPVVNSEGVISIGGVVQPVTMDGRFEEIEKELKSTHMKTLAISDYEKKMSIHFAPYWRGVSAEERQRVLRTQEFLREMSQRVREEKDYATLKTVPADSETQAEEAKVRRFLSTVEGTDVQAAEDVDEASNPMGEFVKSYQFQRHSTETSERLQNKLRQRNYRKAMTKGATPAAAEIPVSDIASERTIAPVPYQALEANDESLKLIEELLEFNRLSLASTGASISESSESSESFFSTSPSSYSPLATKSGPAPPTKNPQMEKLHKLDAQAEHEGPERRAIDEIKRVIRKTRAIHRQHHLLDVRIAALEQLLTQRNNEAIAPHLTPRHKQLMEKMKTKAADSVGLSAEEEVEFMELNEKLSAKLAQAMPDRFTSEAQQLTQEIQYYSSDLVRLANEQDQLVASRDSAEKATELLQQWGIESEKAKQQQNSSLASDRDAFIAAVLRGGDERTRSALRGANVESFLLHKMFLGPTNTITADQVEEYEDASEEIKLTLILRTLPQHVFNALIDQSLHASRAAVAGVPIVGAIPLDQNTTHLDALRARLDKELAKTRASLSPDSPALISDEQDPIVARAAAEYDANIEALKKEILARRKQQKKSKKVSSSDSTTTTTTAAAAATTTSHSSESASPAQYNYTTSSMAESADSTSADIPFDLSVFDTIESVDDITPELLRRAGITVTDAEWRSMEKEIDTTAQKWVNLLPANKSNSVISGELDALEKYQDELEEVEQAGDSDQAAALFEAEEADGVYEGDLEGEDELQKLSTRDNDPLSVLDTLDVSDRLLGKASKAKLAKLEAEIGNEIGEFEETAEMRKIDQLQSKLAAAAATSVTATGKARLVGAGLEAEIGEIGEIDDAQIAAELEALETKLEALEVEDSAKFAALKEMGVAEDDEELLDEDKLLEDTELDTKLAQLAATPADATRKDTAIEAGQLAEIEELEALQRKSGKPVGLEEGLKEIGETDEDGEEKILAEIEALQLDDKDVLALEELIAATPARTLEDEQSPAVRARDRLASRESRIALDAGEEDDDEEAIEATQELLEEELDPKEHLKEAALFAEDELLRASAIRRNLNLPFTSSPQAITADSSNTIFDEGRLAIAKDADLAQLAASSAFGPSSDARRSKAPLAAQNPFGGLDPNDPLVKLAYEEVLAEDAEAKHSIFKPRVTNLSRNKPSATYELSEFDADSYVIEKAEEKDMLRRTGGDLSLHPLLTLDMTDAAAVSAYIGSLPDVLYSKDGGIFRADLEEEAKFERSMDPTTFSRDYKPQASEELALIDSIREGIASLPSETINAQIKQAEKRGDTELVQTLRDLFGGSKTASSILALTKWDVEDIISIGQKILTLIANENANESLRAIGSATLQLFSQPAFFKGDKEKAKMVRDALPIPSIGSPALQQLVEQLKSPDGELVQMLHYFVNYATMTEEEKTGPMKLFEESLARGAEEQAEYVEWMHNLARTGQYERVGRELHRLGVFKHGEYRDTMKEFEAFQKKVQEETENFSLTVSQMIAALRGVSSIPRPELGERIAVHESHTMTDSDLLSGIGGKDNFPVRSEPSPDGRLMWTRSVDPKRQSSRYFIDPNTGVEYEIDLDLKRAISAWKIAWNPEMAYEASLPPSPQSLSSLLGVSDGVIDENRKKASVLTSREAALVDSLDLEELKSLLVERGQSPDSSSYGITPKDVEDQYKWEKYYSIATKDLQPVSIFPPSRPFPLPGHGVDDAPTLEEYMLRQERLGLEGELDPQTPLEREIVWKSGADSGLSLENAYNAMIENDGAYDPLPALGGSDWILSDPNDPAIHHWTRFSAHAEGGITLKIDPSVFTHDGITFEVERVAIILPSAGKLFLSEKVLNKFDSTKDLTDTAEQIKASHKMMSPEFKQAELLAADDDINASDDTPVSVHPEIQQFIENHESGQNELGRAAMENKNLDLLKPSYPMMRQRVFDIPHNLLISLKKVKWPDSQDLYTREAKGIFDTGSENPMGLSEMPGDTLPATNADVHLDHFREYLAAASHKLQQAVQRDQESL